MIGEEEVPDAVALSRQISDQPSAGSNPRGSQPASLQGSLEGPPDNTPVGSPLRRPALFSRDASPIQEEGTPEFSARQEPDEIPDLVLNP